MCLRKANVEAERGSEVPFITDYSDARESAAEPLVRHGLFDDSECRVGRAVIYNQKLDFPICLVEDGSQRLNHKGFVVEAGHEHTDQPRDAVRVDQRQ